MTDPAKPTTARPWSLPADSSQPSRAPDWNPSPDTFAAHPRYGAIRPVAICDAAGAVRFDQPVWTEPPGGAVAVPVTAKGDVVLLRQWRPALRPPRPGGWSHLAAPEELGGYSWELPRGFAEPGETPADCAAREVGEETGLAVDGAELIGWANPNTTFFADPIPVVRVRIVGTVRAAPDADEHIVAVRAFDRAALREAIGTGQIRCALTLAGLAAHWV
jgi:ADP-ribose pyrophosphatase